MSIQYQLFYRRHGIRRDENLSNPTLSDMKTLELPLDSVYHYQTTIGAELGPPVDDYLFRLIKKPIIVNSILELNEFKGMPKKISSNGHELMRDYHSTNRKTRPMRDLSFVDRDPNTLLVCNYCLLSRTHRYIRSFYTEYYQWYNEFATMMDTITTIANTSLRQHFIIAKSPKVIPSLQQLTVATEAFDTKLMGSMGFGFGDIELDETTQPSLEGISGNNKFLDAVNRQLTSLSLEAFSLEEMTTAMLKVFRDKESYVLLELWKWLGPKRSESLFHRIPDNKIHLVNIIYEESGKWVVINLGVLNSFRVPDTAKPEFLLPPVASLSGLQLQKRLLRMYMTIMEARTVSSVDTLPGVSEEPVDPETLDEDDDAFGDLDDDEDKPVGADGEVDVVTDLPPDEVAATVHQVDDEDDEEVTEEMIKARIVAEDAQLEEDLSLLNEIAQKQEGAAREKETTLREAIYGDPQSNLEDSIFQMSSQLAEDGLMSAAEYKKIIKASTAYKTLMSPDGKTTLEEFIKIPPEMLKITESSSVPDSHTVLDKSMNKSSLLSFDERYITDVLQKDLAGMVLNVQKAGYCITNYKVEDVSDIMGSYKTFRVGNLPVTGKPSTWVFKIPVIDRDGTYEANGVKYRLRKQRGDLPIRKISHNKVALTSYYGKIFVTRSRRKTDDYAHWINARIMEKVLNKDDTDYSEIVTMDVFDQTLLAPRQYTAISSSFKSFTCKGFRFTFDHSEVLKTYLPELIKEHEVEGSILVAKNETGMHLLLDMDGTLYTISGKMVTPIGPIETFLGINAINAPVEYVSVGIFGKDIPIGIYLGLQMGFDKLLRLLKVSPRRVQAGARVNLGAHEYALTFSDETLVFNRDNRFASMVLAGFTEYGKALRLFSVHSFNKRGVYVNLLESNGIGARYIREINMSSKLFVDPITKDLLIEMKEPTTFQGLLLRSCELLMNDQHPDELDPKFMRIKGYERLAGAVYTELIQSLRVHNGKTNKSGSSVEMNPYAVWRRISEDSSKSQVSEINPIHALKEMEAVTLGGTGGRNKRSMVRATRTFHENDVGTISESTVDSGDVGINIFTSADPLFTSLRGMSKPYEHGKSGPTSLLSTSALLAPGSDRDDPKRVNFIAIQQDHVVPCVGYHQPIIRTGYDSVIGHRSYDMFAYTAKKPGVVESIDDVGIIVKYDDGEKQGYQIGRRFGNAAGLIIPHQVVTPFKVGQKVAIGDAIVYNTGFFEPDFFKPTQVVLKNAAYINVVLWESSQTFEDASSISKRAAALLETKSTKKKTIVVRFDQTITKLVNVGQKVEADSVLGYIEDAVTANNKLFTEQTIDTLKAVSANSPKAKVAGVVEKIEVFYRGDMEEMSESLYDLANTSNKRLKKEAASLNKRAFTGLVDGGYRIEGEQLPQDCVAISIYITSDVGTGEGDKGAFCNQLKTVFSELQESVMTTEDGVVVDAAFGGKSIQARIVNSADIIGTSAMLLDIITDKAIAIYYGEVAA